MKKSLLKCFGTGLIVFALSVTFHQQATAQVDRPVERPVPVVTDNDDGFGWGWLGLLGLLGLGGLAGLDRQRTKRRGPVTSVSGHADRV